MEMKNNSESVWVKIFANKPSHYVASWYRQQKGLSKTSSCFEISLIILSLSIKVKNFHVLGDFNFREIVWPARLSKSGSMLKSVQRTNVS